MATKKIPLKSVNLDPKIHTRTAVNPSRIEWFAKLLVGTAQGDGPCLPPVIAYFDGTTYWIADGYHRCHAHIKAGKDTIEAIVHKGGAREAFLAGLAYDQGIPKTRADKQKNVLKALEDPELAKWSDRSLARHCGVDHKTVGKLRSGQVGNSPPPDGEPVVGADGKNYKTKKTRQVGNSPPPEPETTPEPAHESGGEFPTSQSVNDTVSQDDASGQDDNIIMVGPPIDLSDPIFAEGEKEPDPEFVPGETVREVIAHSGLPKPLNWSKGEGAKSKAVLPPEEPLKVLVIKMTGEDAGEVIEAAEGTIWDVMKRYKKRDGLRFACGVGVRKGQKVGRIWEDEPEPEVEDPMRGKRDAIPAEWLGPIHRLLELGVDAARFIRLLNKFIDRVESEAG